ncbi:MAG: oligosaccharide flippase family protein, partial [Chitinispirillia bacterium]|nr:oligosaccharide flippase family protein [Chitinispirillia bacterium]
MSLAAKILLSSFAAMILYRCTVRWRPKPEFCAKSFKELFKTGGALTLATVLWVLCANMSTILIGRIYASLQLGYYSFSDRIVNMASNNITLAVQQVSFTSFSKIQDDNARLLNAQRQVVQSAAAIILPILTALAIMAEPLFALFLNESWMPAIPYLRILCVSGALMSIYTITNNVLLVKDAGLYLKIDYTAVLTLAALILTLVPLGIDVFLIGQAVHTLVLIAVIDYFKSRLLKCRFGEPFRCIAPVAVASAIMGGALHFTMKQFDNIGLIHCAALAAGGAAVYGLCLLILRVEAFTQLVGAIKHVRRH